jgi:hypothetical protein
MQQFFDFLRFRSWFRSFLLQLVHQLFEVFGL